MKFSERRDLLATMMIVRTEAVFLITPTGQSRFKTIKTKTGKTKDLQKKQ
jgi:hypothetical protein